MDVMICPSCRSDLVVEQYHPTEQCFFSKCLSKSCRWFETQYIGKVNPRPVPSIEGDLPKHKIRGILV